MSTKKFKKPTVEQVAWVVGKIIENGCFGGTYRKCIYDFMGYGPEAYIPLCSKGTDLLALNNFIYEHQEDFMKHFGGKEMKEGYKIWREMFESAKREQKKRGKALLSWLEKTFGGKK